MSFLSFWQRLLNGAPGRKSQPIAKVGELGEASPDVVATRDLKLIEPAPVYLAICAIMKDEAIGIRDWIAYHRAVGVERFYLYDNGSSDGTPQKVAPLVEQGIVVLTDWPRKPGQIEAYDDFAQRFRQEAFWCAFIDLDEYINPFACASIPEWLKGFEQHSAVALQWLNFGPDGHDEPPTGLIIEAYQHRLSDDTGVHGHVKTIVRMDSYDRAIGPHSFFVSKGEVVDEYHQPVHRNGIDYAIQQPLLHEQACINHYYTRSRREWRIKLARGLADAGDQSENGRNPLWLDIYEEHAVVHDCRILKFAERTRDALEEIDPR